MGNSQALLRKQLYNGNCGFKHMTGIGNGPQAFYYLLQANMEVIGPEQKCTNIMNYEGAGEKG